MQPSSANVQTETKVTQLDCPSIDSGVFWILHNVPKIGFNLSETKLKCLSTRIETR